MSSISIKWNHRGAFRRFGLPIPANGDLYGALMAKVLAVQPDFNESLAWKDAEGDMIVFSSTTELTEAINSMKNDEPLRIFSINDVEKQSAQTQQQKTTSEPNSNVEHPNVMCDSCDGAVRGIRYKCMSCADFDLCQNCEKEGKHAQHPMARIADPNDRSWMAHHALFMRKMCKGMRHQGPWGPGRGPHHWWRQQMRQQQQAEGGQDANQVPPQPAEFFNSGMDFLREVGVTVAEALTNLGIAVDVDVEHDGAREKVAEPAKNTSQPADAPKEQQQQQQQPTAPTAPQHQDQAMPVDSLEQQMQQAQIDSNNGNAAHDWTMIEGTESPTSSPPQPGSSHQPLYPDVSASIHHPDPRINKTLNDLMAMGFDNQDGWLQQLVESKRGDINAVLNALQPRH